MRLPGLACTPLLIALLACSDASAPTDTLRPSFAEAQTINFDFPVDYLMTSCTGEEVQVTGTYHFKSHETVQPDGDVNFEITQNSQNTQAVALITGAGYVATDELSETVQDIPPGGTAKFESDFHLVRSGETTLLDDDFRLHSLFHVTVNANGIITVDNFDLRAECT